MTINHSRNEKNLVVSPIGRLDSATSGEFSDFLSQNFTDDVEKLTLDFSNVDFISSKGLRVIVSTYKSLNGRKLEVTGCNTSIHEIFRLSGLLKVLDIK